MTELIIRERERERESLTKFSGKEAVHWHKPSERGFEALGGNLNG